MRTTQMKLHLPSLALAVALAACADASANDANQDELKRDLELASTTTMNLVTPRVDSALLSAMETKSLAAPEAATVVRRGAGTRAVRSQTPTVTAAPDADVAAVEETLEQVETESIAPAPEVAEPVAVAPRPQPVVIQTGGAGDYGVGTGGVGTGRGGVVLRGGGVDGDNCDLHRRGGRGGTIYRGPVYTTPNNPIPRISIAGSGRGGMTTAGPSRTTVLPSSPGPASRPSRGFRSR